MLNLVYIYICIMAGDWQELIQQFIASLPISLYKVMEFD